jgi:hypothetical protein
MRTVKLGDIPERGTFFDHHNNRYEVVKEIGKHRETFCVQRADGNPPRVVPLFSGPDREVFVAD